MRRILPPCPLCSGISLAAALAVAFVLGQSSCVAKGMIDDSGDADTDTDSDTDTEDTGDTGIPGEIDDDTCDNGKCVAGKEIWLDTLAGSIAGYADGAAASAKFQYPNGVLTSADVSRYLEANHDIDPDDERRRKFFDRGNGNFSAPSRDGNIKGKQRVAFPKPFRWDDNYERVYDRRRVFGRALGSARPFEPVDIMICRQSL